MNELLLAIDWEVGPYYNEVLDNGGGMPPIEDMVELVERGLVSYNYTEGMRAPRNKGVQVGVTYDEIYDAIAAEYYPHLVLLSMPEMLVWCEQEVVLRFNDFDKALSEFYTLDPYHYLVTIDGVPMFMREAITIVYEMKHSGHYKE